MSRLRSIAQTWGRCAAGLLVALTAEIASAASAETTVPFDCVPECAPNPAVTPLTSFELSQLAHHFELSSDADEVLELMRRAPIDPAERFYVSDRRCAEHVLSSLTTIEQIHKAELGVALLNNHGIVLLYSDEQFPLMSVMKFHVAYAVLTKMAEQGQKLSDTITVKLKELDPDTYSPMYEELKRRDFMGSYCGANEHLAAALQQSQVSAPPSGLASYLLHARTQSSATVSSRLPALSGHPQEFQLCLGDLIYYAVRESDNNACDLLITKYLGGMAALEDFWHQKGVTGLRLKYTEAQMAEEVERCYDNSATPYDVAQSYAIYLNDETLPSDLRHFLDETMLFAPTGAERIQQGLRRALSELATDYEQEQALFKTLRVFDKTGTGGMNEAGRRIAVNDMAFISYEGKPYILVVLVKNIPGTDKTSMVDGVLALRKATRVAFTYALNLYHHAQIVTPIDLVQSCGSRNEHVNITRRSHD